MVVYIVVYIVVVYMVVATEGTPYCGFKGKVTRPGPAGPAGRPGLDAPMSRTLGWGMWSDGVMGVMVFPGVSRHAESDFDVRLTPRCLQIVQPEHTPMSRYVTLLSRCSPAGPGFESRQGHLWSSVALRPSGVLLVATEGRSLLYIQG